MGYSTHKSAGKAPTTGDQIGNGEIQTKHLSPELFLELQRTATHSHTGVKSRKVQLRDLEGSFGVNGFYMYSSDGTKRYKVTIDSGTGAFALAEG